ncbi:methyltransferase domain-containing protein [Compostibacter hankyongensis]|uniref:Class I SAM-dependent methyltransferase n=1 Tax=Compostibacter hankyongensis TaxID=1007089 RepID=A0ABP8G455_9BACT
MTEMQWNAGCYDERHGFVAEYGNVLLDLLDIRPGMEVLDLGCGTGHHAAKMAEQGAVVTGVDSSPDMIRQARLLYPGINFKLQDATALSGEQQFDAVFSNAALHWMQEQEKVLAAVCGVLKPGGRFVAEMGGKGNVGLVTGAISAVLEKHGYKTQAARKVWYFPAPGAYAALLEQTGFVLRLLQYFDRETLLEDADNGVADWLMMFGGALFEGIPEAEQQDLAREAQELLRPSCYRNGRWYADYRRLRFVAEKPLPPETEVKGER